VSNLNLLDTGDPSVDGMMALNGMNERLLVVAKENRAELRVFLSNTEDEIVNAIHAAADWADGFIINPVRLERILMLSLMHWLSVASLPS
jgi:3-dehydroquinate dehydratase